MKTVFLFRLDGSRDNDEFFELRCTRGITDAYSGRPLKIGPGWIPDLIEVRTDTAAGLVTITLIELEASEIVAKASARKYLPEASDRIVETVKVYLNTVIAQCRQTADPRGDNLQRLVQLISDNPRFEVRTAAALRNEPSFIEDLPLIDQPGAIKSDLNQQAPTKHPFLFQGSKPLSRSEINGAIRVIRIFDDVIHGRGISDGTLRSWRNLRVKPFHRAIEKAPQNYPELSRLLAEKTDRGMRLDCDQTCSELAEMWSSSQHYKLTADRIAEAITNFYPAAVVMKQHEPMRNVFDKAHSVLEKLS